MSYIPSSSGPWGFFDPAGSYVPGLEWIEQWYAKGHSYLFQLPGIFIFILIIGSLFIFKKYYIRTTNWRWFRISIGIYQIATYFLFYILSVIYLATVLKTNWWSGPVGPSQVRSLSEMFPLHLCSIHQFLSGFILIFPTKRFFEICAPSALVLPILAIVTPVNGYWSFDNFFYWNYFILHTLIIFAYLYVYLYALKGKPYDGLLLRYQLLWLTAFSIIAVVWNWSFHTNQLFVGPNGGDHWNSGGFNVGPWNTNYIFGRYRWPFAWLAMFILGIIMVMITHVIIFSLPQYPSSNKRSKTWETSLARKAANKIKYRYIAFTFKCIFLPIPKIKIQLKQFSREVK